MAIVSDTNKKGTLAPPARAEGRLNGTTDPGVSTSPEGGAANAIRSSIDDLFLNESHIKKALSANLSKRAGDSLAIRADATAAFKRFSASKKVSSISSAAGEDGGPAFTAASVVPFTLLQGVAQAGADKLRGSAKGRTLRIQESPAFMAMVNTQNANGSVVGTVPLGELLDFLSTEIENLPAGRRARVSPCQADHAAEALLREIEGLVPLETSDHNSGSSGRATDGALADHAEDAQSLVNRQVGRLMEKTTAPEELLRFDVPTRKDRAALQEAIESFELRSGPSDVTSYHDFSSLQIAFQHVWTEVFDGQLASLGKEIYCEYVKLKSFLGLSNQTGRTFETLDDLAALLDEVRDLSKVAIDDTPGVLGAPASNGDNGGSVLDSAKDMLPANVIAKATGSTVLGAVVDPAGALFTAISQAFAGKPTLKWEDFETAGSGVEHPLPIEGDRIEVRFEPDAVPPGQVHIMIASTKDTWWWKAIEFTEIGSDGKIVDRKKAATEIDKVKGWNPDRTNTLQLATSQLKNGIIEFQKDAPRGIGGFPTGFYLLTGLDQKIQDRMRVTFTWVKD